MNTFLRAPTLEMPDDVLDDLRNRAAADERRGTAQLGVPMLPEAFETMPRAGRVTPYFSVNLRVPTPRPPSVPSSPGSLAAVSSTVVAPAAVDARSPQARVQRAVVIGLSFGVTLALGLAFAI